jgi:zeaxanthin glucosyltransferase
MPAVHFKITLRWIMHIGVVCPPAIGHLNPMCALAHELKGRGNKITFFAVADAAALIESSGIDCVIFGKTEFPTGSLGAIQRRQGQLTGFTALRFTQAYMRRVRQAMFQHLPYEIKKTGLNGILIDQACLGCGTIADYCGVPFVMICNALPLNWEDRVPPVITCWRYRDTLAARFRNKLANYMFVQLLTRRTFNTIQIQRTAWGLPPYSHWQDSRGLGIICQLPVEFDFPRKELTDDFHYVGPLQNPLRDESISYKRPRFPFERLSGKPLIYASLGSMQNQIRDIFYKIAAACDCLDAQLVISLGDPESPVLSTDFPGNPIVVKYAPHQQIIDRAALVITHAGLNTTLGALSSGVPMVAIPITFEQPGVAVRMVRTGAGEMLPVSKLTIDRLRKLVTRVLSTESYRENALRMKEAIHRAGGVVRAADIVLEAVTTKRHVLRGRLISVE